MKTLNWLAILLVLCLFVSFAVVACGDDDGGDDDDDDDTADDDDDTADDDDDIESPDLIVYINEFGVKGDPVTPYLMKFMDETWSAIDLPEDMNTAAFINSAIAPTENDVWISVKNPDDEYHLFRLLNGTWEKIEIPIDGVTRLYIAYAFADEVWIAMDQGSANEDLWCHWDGSSLTQIDFPENTDGWNLWCESTIGCFVPDSSSAKDKSASVYRWDGSAWESLAINPALLPEDVLAFEIHSLADDTPYFQFYPDNGNAIYKYDGDNLANFAPAGVPQTDTIDISGYWLTAVDQDETQVRTFRWEDGWQEYQVQGDSSGFNYGEVYESYNPGPDLSMQYLALVSFDGGYDLQDYRVYIFNGSEWEQTDLGLGSWVPQYDWDFNSDIKWGTAVNLDDGYDALARFNGDEWEIVDLSGYQGNIRWLYPKFTHHDEGYCSVFARDGDSDSFGYLYYFDGDDWTKIKDMGDRDWVTTKQGASVWMWGSEECPDSGDHYCTFAYGCSDGLCGSLEFGQIGALDQYSAERVAIGNWEGGWW